MKSCLEVFEAALNTFVTFNIVHDVGSHKLTFAKLVNAYNY